jgi:hypothetical protein
MAREALVCHPSFAKIDQDEDDLLIEERPMLHSALVTCSLAMLGAVPVGQEIKEGPPQQPAPSFNYISALNKGTGEVRLLRAVTAPVMVPVQTTINENGVVKTVTQYQTTYVTRQEETAFSLKKGSVYTTDGKKLSEADALERLKLGAIVLQSTNGQPVDPLFLRAVRAETLVLVGPLPMATAAPAVRPAAIAVPAQRAVPVPAPAPKIAPPAPRP